MIREIPLNQLIASPRNVRKARAEPDAGMMATIAARGRPYQNLVVSPELDDAGAETGRFFVEAGERRRRACVKLVKARKLKKDAQIPCEVIAADDALEASTVENTQREAMHPADEFEAFKAMVDAGRPIEDVAARFGVTPLVVQRRLKLADVSPRLVTEYREGRANLDQMMALAVCDDHAAQEAAWFEAQSWDRQPQVLRQRLTQDELHAGSSLARFVGLEAYEAAGGPVRRDLFGHVGPFLADRALVEQMAGAALEAHAETLRAEGWAWVEVRLAFTYQDLEAFGRLRPKVRPCTVEESRRVDELNARLESYMGHDELSDDEAVEIDGIEAELEALSVARQGYGEAIGLVGGAIVTIGHGGQVRIERGLVRPEDEAQLETEEDADPGYRPATVATSAKPQVPGGISESLAQSLTAHRTMALRATLAADPDVALRAVVHSLLLTTHGPFGAVSGGELCVGVTPDRLWERAPSRHAAGLEETVAGQELARLADRMGEELPAAEHLWTHLAGCDRHLLLEYLAYAAARTVDAVYKRGGGAQAVQADQLAEALGLDMADWWEPTAESYFGRVSKAQALDAVREFKGASTADNWAKLKKGEVAERAEAAAKGSRWLPAILRKPAGEADALADPDPQQIADE